MPRTGLAALLLIHLTACTGLQVDLRFVADEVELRQQCGDDMRAEPLGCALKHGNQCTIVAYMPRHFEDHRRLETLGHELWHCVAGAKHL